MNIYQKKETIEYITELVLKEIASQGFQFHEKRNHVPVSISARHLHLSKEHLDILFGINYRLSKIKYISQPGQFAADETVTILGPKGKIENVRILGPVRKETQVEISTTDAIKIGIKPVVAEENESLTGTPGVVIIGPKGTVEIEYGCMVASRHIHMTPSDAVSFGVSDGQRVSVKVNGIRGGILDNVAIRVREDFALDFHIDVDEANAFFISNGDMLEVIK